MNAKPLQYPAYGLQGLFFRSRCGLRLIHASTQTVLFTLGASAYLFFRAAGDRKDGDGGGGGLCHGVFSDPPHE